MKPNNSLTVRETATYSVGALGREISASVVNVFCMLYLTAIVGLDGLTVGICFALAKVWDAVNDPIVAVLVNNTRSRWGRYRPWIFIGVLLNSAALVALFAPLPDLSIGAKYVYYIGMYVLWGMTYTTVDIPFWSMIPSIANTTHERNTVSSYARLVGGFGGFIISSIGPVIMGRTFGNKDARSYFLVAGIGVLIFVSMMMVMLAGNKERYQLPQERIRFRDFFTLFRGNDQLQAYALSFVLFCTSSTLALQQIVYLFTYEPTLEYQHYGLFVAISCTGQGIAMIFYPWIAKKIRREKIYASTFALGIIGMLGLFFIFFILGSNKLLNVLLASLAGSCLMMSNGLNQIGSTVMVSDIVDYGEYISGIRTDSVIFSVQTLLSKGAGAFATLILGIGMRAANLPPVDSVTQEFAGIVTPEMMQTLRVFMFLVPIPLMAAGYVIYKRKYTLYGTRYDNIKAEIEARREQP